MKLTGRRESTNVEDRRGRRASGGLLAGGGIGAIIIGVLFALLSGGDPTSALQQIDLSQLGSPTQEVNAQEFTEEEQELAKFSKQVLASTEDVWTKIFEQMGKTYTPPKLVLFTGSVQSACGDATAAVGPFYCSDDQCLYIDLSFFSQMKQQLGADGDFAYAYVIAHEVGHHVEHLLGTLSEKHADMQRMNKVDANKVSVRIELQADFYAGVWGHHEQSLHNSLEEGDLEEAIDCAHKIGDNYLQQKAQGRVQQESFTHGTSAQRMKWLKLGLQTGNMALGDTYSKSDAEL